MTWNHHNPPPQTLQISDKPSGGCAICSLTPSTGKQNRCGPFSSLEGCHFEIFGQTLLFRTIPPFQYFRNFFSTEQIWDQRPVKAQEQNPTAEELVAYQVNPAQRRYHHIPMMLKLLIHSIIFMYINHFIYLFLCRLVKIKFIYFIIFHFLAFYFIMLYAIVFVIS